MISIPINKSFSQISVVSSKLAPDEKDEGRNEGEKDREREKEKRKWEKLERVFRRLFPGRRKIVFFETERQE